MSQTLLKECFFGQTPIDRYNFIDIILISKGKQQNTLANFIWIGQFCYIIYKIHAKLVCNRPAKYLPTVIFDAQYAFIKNRSTMDNVMVGLE